MLLILFYPKRHAKENQKKRLAMRANEQQMLNQTNAYQPYFVMLLGVVCICHAPCAHSVQWSA
jgi:hypothetical protein